MQYRERFAVKFKRPLTCTLIVASGVLYYAPFKFGEDQRAGFVHCYIAMSKYILYIIRKNIRFITVGQVKMGSFNRKPFQNLSITFSNPIHTQMPDSISSNNLNLFINR